MTCPSLVVDCYTPKLMWYQTDITVIIRVLLPDVLDYYLRVENDLLLFSTIINNQKYYLCLYLFGPVVAEKTVHKNVGREIKIYLTKQLKWFQWLRLIRAKEKSSLITCDPDHLYEIDYTKKNIIKEDIIQKQKQQNEVRYIMPFVPSSDEEESEDEGLDFNNFS